MNIFKPKKSLGQHFLRDQKALEQIVAAAELQPDDKVLEIGPGKGALTNALMNALTSGKLIAVEKDGNLASNLAINFKFQISNFKSISNDPIVNFKNKAAVIEGDILEINLPKLVERNDLFGYKVVANIPYYITGKIVRLLLETEYQPKLIVLLVQKEVAERICAKRGKMSILAVAVQYYGKPEIISIVRKESFSPMPEVDSAVLKIVPHGIQPQEKASDFFRIVKTGFSSPRKTLANNLAGGLKLEKSRVLDALEKEGFSENTRAQELGIEDWKRLEKNFFENK